MANPYTDPKYQMARLMRAQGGGGSAAYSIGGPAPSKAAVSLGRAASNLAAANPTLADRLNMIAKTGSTGEKPSGVAGLILDNPLVKAGLKPLSLLAIPGRYTVAATRELVDSLDNDPTTKASFSDFKKNASDAKYGFGTAFAHTGNKWLDRTIGFAGDVILDPLNLVTFGAGKTAGLANRLQLAANVLEKTGDARLANMVQQYGRSAIKNPEVLERVGANRHGLYVFGKRIKVGKNQQGLKIPGTGVIGQLGDSALSKLRVSASRTKAGQWIQKMTMPSDGLAARRALASGKLGDDAAASLIAYFSSAPVMRRAEGEALQREANLTQGFLTKESNLGLDGYKNEMHKYLESPELLANASPEIQRAVSEWGSGGFFGWYEKQIQDMYKAIDPAAEAPMIENFFPRIQTDAGLAYRANPANRHSRTLNEIWSRDPLEGGKNFKSRSLREGDDWFGHRLTADDIKSTDRLNELAREELGGANFFETDITKVATRYVQEFSREMGMLARHKHLVDNGFWKRAEQVVVGGEFVDKPAVDLLRKEIKSLVDDISAAHLETRKAYANISEASMKQAASTEAELAELSGSKGFLGAREALASAESAFDDVLTGSMTITADTLQTVADNLGNVAGRFAKLFGAEYKKGRLVLAGTDNLVDDSPGVVNGLLGYIDNVRADVQRLHERMWVLEQDITGKELRAVHAERAKELALVEQRMRDLAKSVQEIAQVSNQLESSIQSILRGDDLDSVVEQVDLINRIIGRDLKGVTRDHVFRKMREIFGVKGRSADAIRETLRTDGTFRTLAVNSPVRESRISKMTPRTFYDKMPRMFHAEMSLHGDLTLQDVREMGIWALLNDTNLHGENIPEALKPVRDKLISRLIDADEAQAFSEQVSKQLGAEGKLSAEKVFEGQWHPAMERALNVEDMLSKVRNFRKNSRFAQLIGTPTGESLANTYITRTYSDVLIEQNPWMAELFGDGLVSEDGTVQYLARDYYEELMGADTVVDPEDIAGAGRFGGRRASGINVVGEMTYGELFEKVQRMEQQLAESLENPEFFSVGAGATAKSYSGYDVIERYRKYDSLKKKIAIMNQQQKREVSAMVDELGLREQIDKLERQKALTTKGSAERERIQEEINMVMLPARTRAAQRLEARRSAAGIRSRSELLQEFREVTGGYGLVRGDWFGGGQVVHNELASSLIDYMMVSETMTRFKAVAMVLEPFGMVPTEDMFRVITSTVGGKFIPNIDSQLSATYAAGSILRNLDTQIATAIRQGENAGRTPSQIFKEFVGQLSTNERETLTQAIGYRADWGADPYTLRRGLKTYLSGLSGSAKTARENEYFDRYVRPWFVAANPGVTPTKEAMRAELKKYVPSVAKTAKKAYITPWADDADIGAVKRWFEDLIGDSSIPGRSTRTVGRVLTGATSGRGVSSEVTRLYRSANEIGVKIRQLDNMKERFVRMLTPDADVAAFIENPSLVQKTPTYYAYMLDWHRRDIETRMRNHGTISGEMGAAEQNLKDLSELFGKESAAAQAISRGEIPDSIRKQIDEARVKVDAFNKKTSAEKFIVDNKKQYEELQRLSRSKRMTPDQRKQYAELKKQVEAARKDIRSFKDAAKPTEREVKLASAGSTVRPRRARGAAPGPKLIAEAEAASVRAVDEYNSIMSSIDFASAEHDRDIVNAMMMLADYDMWKYSDGFSYAVPKPDYKPTATFMTSIEEYDDVLRSGQYDAVHASIKGNRIVFSQAEWESLFIPVRKEENIAAKRNDSIRQIQVLGGQNGALTRRLAKEEEVLAEQTRRLDSWDNGSFYDDYDVPNVKSSNFARFRRGLVARVEEARAVVEETKRLIRENSTRMNEVRLDMDIYNPATRASALDKMRVLVHGTEDSRPIFDGPGLEKFMAGKTAYQRKMEIDNAIPYSQRVSSSVVTRDANASAGVGGKVEEVSVNVDKTLIPNNLLSKMTQTTGSRPAWRRKALESVWQESKEYKLLKRLDELKSDVFVSTYIKHMNGAASAQAAMNSASAEIAKIADRLAGSAQDVEAAVQRARGTVDNALQGIVERGRAPETDVEAIRAVAEAGEQPAQFDAAADTIRRVSQPSGPFAERIGGNAELERQYSDLVDLDMQVGEKSARVFEAKRAIDEWEGTATAPSLAKDMRWKSQEWLATREAEKAGGVVGGERQRLLSLARDEWKKRLSRQEDAEAIVEAVTNARSRVRGEMVAMSGTTEQFWRELADGRSMALALRNQIDEIQGVLVAMPPAEALKILKGASKKMPDERVREVLQAYRDWARDARPVFDSVVQDPDNPVLKAYAAASVAEAKLIDLELTRAQKLNELVTAETPVWKNTVIAPFAEGYSKAIEESGMFQGMKRMEVANRLNVYANKDAVDLLKNIDRIRQPGVVDDMARFMRGYTGFFRAYATFSPGFHVRNSISNTFMMFAAGANFGNLREGFRMWRLMQEHFRNGGDLQTWVASLPAEQQVMARNAGSIVLGLGGGKTDDALEGFVRDKNGITSNRGLDISRKVGYSVESSARFMLAWDGLSRGLSENEAFNFVKRHLIDYNERTLLDETMRDIVPFWTWMSRNLPLQIVNRWANPRAYLVYQRAYNNFNEEGELTPGYLQKKMGINLGNGMVISPDLPFTGVNEQLESFASPQKLLSNVNPGIRVPLELIANKKFFSGAEFGDKFVPLTGRYAALQPVFSALGQIQYNSKGEPMVSEKAMYAMTNTIPLLGQLERLAPTTESGQERLGNSLRSFLGIPVQTISEGAEDSERLRRLAAIRQLEQQRKEIG